MCKNTQDESALNKLKRNKDKQVGFGKSCKGCNLEMNENKESFRFKISTFGHQKRWQQNYASKGGC